MFRGIWFGRNGYYGFDLLSGLMILFALILLRWIYTLPLALILAALVIYRTLSKNIDRRRQEQWALQNLLMKIARGFVDFGKWVRKVTRPVSKILSLWQSKWRDRKVYKYVRCPGCRGTLRLPKNKGKIIASCPVCGKEFKMKT